MHKLSLRSKLMYIFGGISVLPIFIMCIYMFYHTEGIFRDNTMKMTQLSLKQSDDNIRLSLDSYEDLLYQIYTDDNVVAWMDAINSHEDVPVATNQLRRYLRGLLNTKRYVRAITIIANDGSVISYDQMAWSTYESSWMGEFSMDKEEIYDELSRDNFLHVFSTEYGCTFNSDEYYLFHLGHRIIDYKQLTKECGVVIVSIDEELLRDILGDTISDEHVDENSVMIPLSFIVDSEGRIIAGGDRSQLGSKIVEKGLSIEERENSYLEYAKKQDESIGLGMSIALVHDDSLEWDIVDVIDETPTLLKLQHNAGITIIVGLASIIIVLVLIWRIAAQLTYYIEHVVHKMKETTDENIPVQIDVSDKMPLEVEIIANQYNQTIEKLETAISMEKQEAENRQVAEIRMLEAQINPHFLYNTLDTINWMAIDKDEFDISNAINALATILRYAISDSNKEVTIKDEMEWLKKYIYLQQFRLKHKFICNVNAEPEIMNYRIHKLLLQPFVENAIVHGFDDDKDEHILNVTVSGKDDRVYIVIEDNGRGVDASFVEAFNEGAFYDFNERGGIGISNALMRLHSYCDGREEIYMESEPGKNTIVKISFPIKE